MMEVTSAIRHWEMGSTASTWNCETFPSAQRSRFAQIPPPRQGTYCIADVLKALPYCPPPLAEVPEEVFEVPVVVFLEGVVRSCMAF